MIVRAEDAGNWLGIRRQLQAARKLLEANAVSPFVDRTFPLDEVPEAIRYLRDRRARRKYRHHGLAIEAEREYKDARLGQRSGMCGYPAPAQLTRGARHLR